MKTLVLALLVCNGTAALAQHHNHTSDSSGKSANKHMHQSSVKDLAEGFDSKERDAYQQPEKVMQYLGDISGKTIMDIGAGSGYFAKRLALAGARVIAADVNEEFQALLKARIEKEHLENIELRKIPYDSPGLKTEEIDMALIVNTYHHIDNRAAYFAKVKKGTRTNGELVVIDFFKSDLPVGPPTEHKISIDTVVSELKAAGYTTFTVEVSLLPYQYIIRAK